MSDHPIQPANGAHSRCVLCGEPFTPATCIHAAGRTAPRDPRGAYGELLDPPGPQFVTPRDVVHVELQLQVKFDPRDMIANVIKDACVAYVKEQNIDTCSTQAADRINELLRRVGITLQPWSQGK